MIPWTDLQPGGAIKSINRSSGRIDITRGFLNGIDFNGAWLYRTEPDDITHIRDCAFGALPPGIPYCISFQLEGRGALMVTACDFGRSTPGQSGLVGWRGDGMLYFNDNHVGQRGQHVLEMVDGSVGLRMTGNLIDGWAQNPGAHDNILQWGRIRPGCTVEVMGNRVSKLASDTLPNVDGGEFFQFYPNVDDGTPLESVTFRHNTLLAGPNAKVSYMLHLGRVKKGLISDNWYDRRGAYGFLYPGATDHWKIANNRDVSGA